MLDDATRQRCGRLRYDADRVRAITAHALLRLALADDLDCSPTEVLITRYCGACGSNDHGAPRTPGRAISLSHAGDRVVVAIGDSGDVGVDVEVPGAVTAAALAAITSPSPSALSQARAGRVWVRTEAALKCVALGLSQGAGTVCVSTDGGTPRVLEWPVELGPRPTLLDLDLDGYPAALAHRPLAGEPQVDTSPVIQCWDDRLLLASSEITARAGREAPGRTATR